jgi:hypothetical protein
MSNDRKKEKLKALIFDPSASMHEREVAVRKLKELEDSEPAELVKVQDAPPPDNPPKQEPERTDTKHPNRRYWEDDGLVFCEDTPDGLTLFFEDKAENAAMLAKLRAGELPMKYPKSSPSSKPAKATKTKTKTTQEPVVIYMHEILPASAQRIYAERGLLGTWIYQFAIYVAILLVYNLLFGVNWGLGGFWVIPTMIFAPFPLYAAFGYSVGWYENRSLRKGKYKTGMRGYINNAFAEQKAKFHKGLEKPGKLNRDDLYDYYRWEALMKKIDGKPFILKPTEPSPWKWGVKGYKREQNPLYDEKRVK